MGRKYYRPKRRKRSGGLLRTVAAALFTAWLSKRTGHVGRFGHQPYRRRSLKQSALSYILKRLARRFT